MAKKKPNNKEKSTEKKEEKFIEDDEQEEIESQKSVLDEIIEIPEEIILPYEEVELPSKGLYYNNEAMKNGIVKIRAMNIHVEKAMANQRLVQSGQALDIMFEKCVMLPDPDFNHLDLLAGDRYFLMFYIRGITYGDEYTFSLECPICGETGLYDFLLSELTSTMKIADEKDAAEYPFKIRLPYISEKINKDVIVGLRLTTGRDLEHLFRGGGRKRFHKRVRARRKIEPTAKGIIINKDDDQLMSIIKSSIADVNGDSTPYKLEKFIEQLHSKDLSVINQFLNEMSPGVDTTIEIDCPHCDSKVGPILLPITEAFFRTTVS